MSVMEANDLSYSYDEYDSETSGNDVDSNDLDSAPSTADMEAFDVGTDDMEAFDVGTDDMGTETTLPDAAANDVCPDESLSESVVGVPFIGQEFDCEEEAYIFYNAYANRSGFSVRRDNKHIEKLTGQIKDRRFVCQKEGWRKQDKRRYDVKTPRRPIRFGCLAKLKIVFNFQIKKFVVQSFVAKHNHETHLTDCAHMMRSQRNFTSAHAAFTNVARQSGVSVMHTFRYMGIEAGGKQNLGFIKDDMKRHLQTRRQRSMAYGEAAMLLEYFQEQRARSPGFYSAYFLDDEQQITNIFWADSKMILDYHNFGDVLTFDTTYKTNNSYRPCAVFAGLSHNRKTTIFGAALMYDETAASFEWLFTQFIHCMSGKEPKTIFTDQAQAISLALERVLPGVKHCLCTWHLTMNMIKHHGWLLKRRITQGWYDCMNSCMSEETFDEVWNAFLQKHKQEENEWFKKTYAVKEKWAHAFLKNTLTLGMASTQVSESLNSVLKKWLKHSIPLLEFFQQFEEVVNTKRYEQLRMEFESRQKHHSSKLKLSPMLYHASQVYTLSIFEKFEVEYLESQGLLIDRDEEYVGGTRYLLARYGNEDNVFSVVACKETEEVTCNCGMFAMCGYLCCHCLKVLDHMNIKKIPTQYILKRWTKEAKFDLYLDFSGLKIKAEPEHRVSQRYHAICRNLVLLATMAAECDEATDYVVKLITEGVKKVAEICLKNKVHPGDGAKDTSTPNVPSSSSRTPTGVNCGVTIRPKRIAKKKENELPRGTPKAHWYFNATHKRKRISRNATKGKAKTKATLGCPAACDEDEDQIEIIPTHNLGSQPTGGMHCTDSGSIPVQYDVCTADATPEITERKGISWELFPPPVTFQTGSFTKLLNAQLSNPSRNAWVGGQPIGPLNKEDLSIVDFALSPSGNDWDVLVDINHHKVTRYDIRTLKPPSHISSPVINAFGLRLNEEEIARPNGKYYFSSDFMYHVLNGSIGKKRKVGLEPTFGRFFESSAIERMLKSDMWMMPLCTNQHWVMFAVNRSEELFYYLDPLNKNVIEGLETIAKNLVYVMKTFLQIKLPFILKAPPEIPLHIPHQTTSFDCGVLIMKYMECWYGRMKGNTVRGENSSIYRSEILTQLLMHPTNKCRATILGQLMIS